MINELEQEIIKWGEEKGILPNPNKVKQLQKTQEEVDELRDAIANDDKVEVKDAIGDIVVTLIMQCQGWNLSLEECIQSAYNVISKRTGKMINGVFVKDE